MLLLLTCDAMQQLLVPHLPFFFCGSSCSFLAWLCSCFGRSTAAGSSRGQAQPQGWWDTDLCLWLFLLLQHRHSCWVCCLLLLHHSHVLNWLLFLSFGGSGPTKSWYHDTEVVCSPISGLKLQGLSCFLEDSPGEKHFQKKPLQLPPPSQPLHWFLRAAEHP